MDSFQYKLVNDWNIHSSEGKIIFDVNVINDKAKTGDAVTINISEDEPTPTKVFLNASDVDDLVISYFITKLPTKGKLYHVPLANDSALLGEAIEAKYEKSIFIEYLEQFVSGVVGVSSFWGGPPYAGYHAMNVIGSPMCVSDPLDVECMGDHRTLFKTYDDGRWFRELSTKDDIGELVLVPRPQGYAKAPGKIVSVDVENNLVNVSIFVMQKTLNGSIVECVIDKADGGFPSDCNESLALQLPRHSETGSALDVQTFHRRQLRGVSNGIWCPLHVGYKEGIAQGGDSARAYGMQYDFSHNQADFYQNSVVDPPHNQYIEVLYDTPVYPSGITIGCTRGCYSVVGVKAKYVNGSSGAPYSEWVTMWKGATDPNKDADRFQKGLYLHFSPPTCHLSFKTTMLRIEIDTTKETGSSDWNYIDYIKLHGTQKMQSAVLRAPSTTLLYVPDKDQNGYDSFEYRASDCLGNDFRASEYRRITLHIKPQNDPPIASYESYSLDVMSNETHSIPMSDLFHNADVHNGDILTFSIEGSNGDGSTRRIRNEQLEFKCRPVDVINEWSETVRFRVRAVDKYGLEAAISVSIKCIYPGKGVDIADVVLISVVATAIVGSIVGIIIWKRTGSIMRALSVLFSPLMQQIGIAVVEVADLISDGLSSYVVQGMDEVGGTIKTAYIVCCVVAVFTACIGVWVRVKSIRFFWNSQHEEDVLRYISMSNKIGVSSFKFKSGKVDAAYKMTCTTDGGPAVSSRRESIAGASELNGTISKLQLKNERTRLEVLCIYITSAVLVAEDIPMLVMNVHVLLVSEGGLNMILIISMLFSAALAGVKFRNVATLPGLWESISLRMEAIEDLRRQIARGGGRKSEISAFMRAEVHSSDSQAKRMISKVAKVSSRFFAKSPSLAARVFSTSSTSEKSEKPQGI